MKHKNLLSHIKQVKQIQRWDTETGKDKFYCKKMQKRCKYLESISISQDFL